MVNSLITAKTPPHADTCQHVAAACVRQSAPMDVSSHTVSFPAGEKVPLWVHLVPAGTFSGVDGRGPYRLRDPQAVITASMAAGKIAIDENHSTMLAVTTGQPAPARGWIVAMEARADGIWGQVEWTEAGTALMADGAYKNLSPVFDHKKDGTVLRIKNAALTNNPNLAALTAMHVAAPEGHMDKTAICTALGLAVTVEDSAVMTALQTAAAAQTALATAQAQIAELQRTTVPVDRVTALQTQLDTMLANGAKTAATAFVDAAIKDGKPIAAARDTYIAMHVNNAAQTEAIIKALPSIHAAGGGTMRTALNDAGDGDGLTAEDIAVCSAMGLDRKAFAKTKALREGRAA